MEEINKPQDYVEDEISLTDIIVIIKKHMIAIVLFLVFGLAFGSIGGVIYDNTRPSYTATATMMVSLNPDNTNLNSAYQYSSYISQTFVAFIGEDVVVDKVTSRFDNLTNKEVKDGLSVSLKSNTLIINLSYKSKDKQGAHDILNCICNTAVEVSNIMNDNDKPRYPLLKDNLSVVTPSEIDKIVTNSSFLKIFLIGFAGSAVLATLYVFLRELLDNSFRNDEQIQNELGLTVIASIPFYTFTEETVEGKITL